MVAQCVTVENGTFLLCVHLMTQGISITPNYILLPLKAALCPHIDGSRTSLGVLVIPGITAYKASFFSPANSQEPVGFEANHSWLSVLHLG